MTVIASRARYVQPSTPRFFATFGYAWVAIVIVLGTVIAAFALGAGRNLFQEHGWGALAQNPIGLAAAAAFFMFSFMLARRLVRTLYRQAPRTRLVALVTLGVLALLAILAWSESPRYLPHIASGTSQHLP